MSTARKSQSARANGAKSRGPVSPEGRAKSSKNALRHGLSAKQIVLPNEDPAAFEAHLAAYFDHFQPSGPIEAELVEIMAAARWRLRRILNIETNLLTYELEDQAEYMDKYVDTDPHVRLAYVFQQLSSKGQSLALVTRYESTLNRTYDRALKQLESLQSTRAPLAPQLQNEPKVEQALSLLPPLNPPGPPPTHPPIAPHPSSPPNPGALS